MAKKVKRIRSPLRKKNNFQTLQILEYEITSEPIMDRQYKQLPGRVKDTIERLHHEAQYHPHKAIPELLELIDKYPKLSMLYNYLSVAYSKAGQREEAEAIIRKNYQQNPDYLFARLNYAELYRAKGEYDKIAEILEYKFDLKLLYPNRTRFHISEVANFMGIVGDYFFETGNRETAEKFFDLLSQIAPGYPMTNVLRQKLHPSPFHKALHQLVNRTKK